MSASVSLPPASRPDRDAACAVLVDAGLSAIESDELVTRLDLATHFGMSAQVTSPLAALLEAGLTPTQLVDLPDHVLTAVATLPRRFPERSAADLTQCALALIDSGRQVASWARIVEALSDPSDVALFARACGPVSTDDGLRLVSRGIPIDDLAWLTSNVTNTSGIGQLAYMPIGAVATLGDPARRRLALLLLTRTTAPPTDVVVALAIAIESGVEEVTRLILDGWSVDKAVSTGLALYRDRVRVPAPPGRAGSTEARRA